MQYKIRGRGVFVGALLAAGLLGLVALVSGSDSAAAISFNPHASVCLDDASTPATCDGSNGPGLNSDMTVSFGVDAPDSNFGGVIGFTPPDWGVAADADITNGSVVAQLFPTATLSLFAGGCNTTLKPNFTLIDASTNIQDTIDASGPSNDTLLNLAQDADNNGVPDGADHYPSFLTRIPALTGLTPRSRQFGWADPVGGLTVTLNFLIFEKGASLTLDAYNPFGLSAGPHALDPAAGYPSVVILNNAGDPTAVPSASVIGDFCAPLVTSTVTYGVALKNNCVGNPSASGCADAVVAAKNRRGVSIGAPNGEKYRTNPSAAGSFEFATTASSQRDADSDGIENSLDACPVNPDPQFDPRQNTSPGDTDGDGLPNSCDPHPDTPSPVARAGFGLPCPTGGILDEDDDCYGNRGDNCPLVANGIDVNNNVIGPDNQKDSDGDGIGDACDANPTTPDGDVKTACVATKIDIGGGGTARDFCNTPLFAEGGSGGEAGATATPAGQTPGPTTRANAGTTNSGSGGVGGPTSGIGTLSPVASSVPGWALVLSLLGAVGLVTSLVLVSSSRLTKRETAEGHVKPDSRRE